MSTAVSKRGATKRARAHKSKPKQYWTPQQPETVQKPTSPVEPTKQKTDPAILFLYGFFGIAMVLVIVFVYLLMG